MSGIFTLKFHVYHDRHLAKWWQFFTMHNKKLEFRHAKPQDMCSVRSYSFMYVKDKEEAPG